MIDRQDNRLVELLRSREARLAGLWAGGLVGGLLLLGVVFYLLPYRPAAALASPILGVLSDGPGLPEDLERPAERSVVRAADGSELAVLSGEENRVTVELDGVPEHARQAVLAIEDADFHAHAGIDHRAIVRAALANLRAGAVAEGGSTITQQLVKNVVLSDDRTVARKVTEARYAIDLERRMDKDEIFERYLNEAYFGEGVYGIGTAAEFYYSTPVDELALPQAAMLAGLIAAPERHNPVDAPDAARARRDVVLGRMADLGYIESDELDEAVAAPLDLALSPLPPPENPFFVEWVRHLLFTDERLDEDPDVREQLVYTGGLEIHTTLDPSLQAAAARAIEEVLTDPVEHPQGTLVTVEPGSGAVRALAVGPREFGECPVGEPDCPMTQVNPAVAGLGASGRQPGSAYKPLVIAAALEQGVPPGWEQETDDGRDIPGCEDEGEPYRPANFDPADGGLKDMHEAVTVSNNVYHARLTGLIEPDPVIDVSARVGLRTGEFPVACALGLGAATVFPVEMATAFATFAAEGRRCGAYAVERVEQGEEVLVEHEPDCAESYDAELAARVTEILRGPVEQGTGTAAQLDRPVAGKTGTTDDFEDAWFVGYVPQMATAAWIGYEEPEPMEGILGVERVTGGTAPAAMWQAYMAEAVAGLEVVDFPDPGPVERVTVPDLEGEHVDDATGGLDDYSFNVTTVSVGHWEDQGTVVNQNLEPGHEVAAGHVLVLEFSDGTEPPPEVPDVRGMSEDEARERLAEAGYEVEVEEDRRTVVLEPDEEPEPAEGAVTEQRPSPGTPLEPEETVTITVVRYDVEREEPEPEPGPPDMEEDDEDEEADDGTLSDGVAREER